MRHRTQKYKFGHGVDNAQMTLRKLCNNFLTIGHMETTFYRAKATKSQIERLIEKSKEKNEANKNVLLRFFGSNVMVEKMFDEIGPQWKNVKGGYVRIIRLTERESDASAMGRLEWSRPMVAQQKEEKITDKKAKKEVIKKEEKK